MGTPAIIGFTVDGRQWVTYSHWDGYPDGVGKDVFAWLQAHLVEQDGELVLNVEVCEVLGSLEVVDQLAEPSKGEIEKLKAHGFEKPERVNTGKDFYAWLHSTQGDLGAILRSGFWLDGKGWDGDWTYIIDADARALTVDGTPIPFAEVATMTAEQFVARAEAVEARS